jgi:hypothetical protein
MAQRKKRISWKEGSIVAIDLGSGQKSFGRLLKRPLIAFYDIKTTTPPPVEEIVRQPVLFKVWTMQYAIKDGDWPIIGYLPLTEELQEQPVFFKQDPITTRLYTYQSIGRNGRDTPATIEQLDGLECAAAWEPEHVVDRLNDHFANRPNKWVEALRPKPVLSEKEQEERIRALDAKYKNLTAKKRVRPTKQKTARPTLKHGKK